MDNSEHLCTIRLSLSDNVRHNTINCYGYQWTVNSHLIIVDYRVQKILTIFLKEAVFKAIS